MFCHSSIRYKWEKGRQKQVTSTDIHWQVFVLGDFDASDTSVTFYRELRNFDFFLHIKSVHGKLFLPFLPMLSRKWPFFKSESNYSRKSPSDNKFFTLHLQHSKHQLKKKFSADGFLPHPILNTGSRVLQVNLLCFVLV